MINPSELKLDTLPWLPLEEKTAFPKRSAIYFAIDSLGTVQYIGRAVNVRNRWGNHHRYNELNAIGNIKIACLFVDLPELLPEIETGLIKYFEPVLNQSLGYCKRDDKTERPNLKLNSAIRKILKNQALLNGRPESAHVEQLVIESEALRNVLNKNPEINAILLPKLNQEIEKLVNETKGDIND